MQSLKEKHDGQRQEKRRREETLLMDMSAVLIDNPEHRKYERLYREFPEYQRRAPGQRHLFGFLDWCSVKAHHTVIDFGCGTGRGAAELAWKTGASVIGIDFVDGCVDPTIAEHFEFRHADLTVPLMLERPADFGYCTDVMEHIPEELVDQVLANILTSARRVFFVIATEEETHGPDLLGEHLHVCVHDADWWRERIKACIHTDITRELVGNGYVAFMATAWATIDDMDHNVTLNVEEERLRANIHGNLALGLKEIGPHPAQDTEINLLCGGPSLNDFAGQIVGPCVTVNGTYNWALNNGIVPGLQVIVDGREFNSRFTDPVVPECKYAVSSQCDPSWVAKLPREQVLLWHGAGDEIHGYVKEYDHAHNIARTYYPVPGGTTVALRALPLLVMLGFRRINVYGLDSCLRGDEHHAYSQPENDGEEVVPIFVDGKKFLCHPWMLKQAHEMQAIIRHVLEPAGVELCFHGDGLIAEIIKAAAAGKE